LSSPLSKNLGLSDSLNTKILNEIGDFNKYYCNLSNSSIISLMGFNLYDKGIKVNNNLLKTLIISTNI